MENPQNSTESSRRVLPRTANPTHGGGNAYLYILVVMTFYGVFLCGIMLGYFHSKRREKRRSNVFTRLVHEEEQREWGALPKRHGAAFPGANVSVHCGNHGNHAGHPRHHHPHPYPHHHHEGALPLPLACALCAEQSSVSSLCSSADARFAIEEESDSGTAEGPEEAAKPGGGAENSGEESG